MDRHTWQNLAEVCRAAAKAAEHQAAMQCLVCISTASPVKWEEGRKGEGRGGEEVCDNGV